MTSVTLQSLYDTYHDRVIRFIMRKTGDSQLAEDLASDVFVKIAKNIDRYDPTKAAPSTWVYTIANNTVLDYFRTRKVNQALPDDNGEDGAVPEYLVQQSDLDAALLMEEQLKLLANALEKLSQRDRDLIILHYYAGLTLKVVAAKMGMSYANAKIVHKKALNILKQYMDI